MLSTGLRLKNTVSDPLGLKNVILSANDRLPTPSSDAIGEVSSTVGFAIPIAIVGYTLCVSIAKIFGNNFGYNISPNQVSYRDRLQACVMALGPLQGSAR